MGVVTTYMPTDVGVPPCQDALGERRGLQLILVKREVLHQQGTRVCCIEAHNRMYITWGLGEGK